MLKILIYVVIGAVGGVLSGMGMGGGTLLIPLLTLFTPLTQHYAQAVNLIAFIPTSVVALIIHSKNGLVSWKNVPVLAIPAVAASVALSILARHVEADNLGVFYGIFLMLLGMIQLVCALKNLAENRKKTAKNSQNPPKRKEKRDNA